eukprot:Platyproteum_vivax@DN7178_c0_g1_i1.p1
MPLKPYKKAIYFDKLRKLVEEHDKILIISADNVGSKQFANVRMALRGKAIVLMGKNTMIRTCLKNHLEKVPAIETLIPLIQFNVGFVFCLTDMNEIRDIIAQFTVPAAARTGAIAPVSVNIPAGNTSLDPAQTSFFQALNIATKIVKGQIEIVAAVDLITQGLKVGASQAALLQKLNILPFKYGIEVLHIYDSGTVYSPKVLDISNDDLTQKFGNAVRNVAAFSRQVGVPTLAAMPHMILGGFKNLASLGFETDNVFPQMKALKDMLDNPNAFVSAAPAAAAKGGGAAPAAAAAPEPEEEEEEEAMDFDLFD